jgi:tRNA (cytosine38-C5)-methyltransferase
MSFDMLLMSPPCQPFTRQGKQQGALDSRSQSFLYLVELIPKSASKTFKLITKNVCQLDFLRLSRLRKKPKYILMENVKGFDDSTARDSFVSMLMTLNYSYQVIFTVFLLRKSQTQINLDFQFRNFYCRPYNLEFRIHD